MEASRCSPDQTAVAKIFPVARSDGRVADLARRGWIIGRGWVARGGGIIERQQDAKCRPAARVGLEVDRSVVSFDDDRVGDRESLAGAAPDGLGGEEGVKHPLGDL